MIEYRTLILKPNSGIVDEAVINDFAKDGWKMVGVLHGSTNASLIFERNSESSIGSVWRDHADQRLREDRGNQSGDTYTAEHLIDAMHNTATSILPDHEYLLGVAEQMDELNFGGVANRMRRAARRVETFDSLVEILENPEEESTVSLLEALTEWASDGVRALPRGAARFNSMARILATTRDANKKLADKLVNAQAADSVHLVERVQGLISKYREHRGKLKTLEMEEAAIECAEFAQYVSEWIEELGV